MRTNLSLMSMVSAVPGVPVTPEDPQARRNPQTSKRFSLQMLLLQQPLDFFSFILIFDHRMTLKSRKLTNLCSVITKQLEWKSRSFEGSLHPPSMQPWPCREVGELVTAAHNEGLCNSVSTHNTSQHVNAVISQANGYCRNIEWQSGCNYGHRLWLV